MKTLILLLILTWAWTAVAQNSNAPSERGAGRRGEPRRFGGPIELKEDDKPAFPVPPAGWDVRREGIPHGKLEMIEYDSKTVATKRKMQVYTPPGYTKDTKYPLHYLLHGIGGDETEWQVLATDMMRRNGNRRCITSCRNSSSNPRSSPRRQTPWYRRGSGALNLKAELASLSQDWAKPGSDVVQKAGLSGRGRRDSCWRLLSAARQAYPRKRTGLQIPACQPIP